MGIPPFSVAPTRFAASVTTQAFGDAGTAGTSKLAARQDHKHAMMALPALDAVAAPTDITTLDASTSAHGLLKKLPNDATNLLNGLGAWTQTGWTLVRKPSDESVTSSTTTQDDDDLKFTAASGSVYEVEMLIIITAGGTTPNIKIGFGEDATVRGAVEGFGLNTSGSAIAQPFACNKTQAAFLATNAKTVAIRVIGSYVGAGGTFVLAWCQNTSDPAAVTVKAGSVLRYRVIS